MDVVTKISRRNNDSCKLAPLTASATRQLAAPFPASSPIGTTSQQALQGGMSRAIKAPTCSEMQEVI
jgi:hypothetical protein